MPNLDFVQIFDNINNKTGGATTVSGTEGETFAPAPGGGVTVTPSTTVKNAAGAGDAVTGLINKLAGQGTLPADAQFGADIAAFIAAAAIEAGIGAVEELAPSAAFIMSGLINKLVDNLLQGNTRDLEYIGNYRNPNRILDAGTNIQLLRRGLIQAQEVLQDMQKDGLDAKHGQYLIDLSDKLIDIADLIDLFYRGVITSKDDLYAQAYKVGWGKDAVDNLVAQFNKLIDVGTAIEMYRRGIVRTGDTDPFDELRRQGWTDDRIDVIKQVQVMLPNLETIKEWKVRQVQDDSVAAKYGFDTGLDEDFYARAGKLGWDKETAKFMYRTTWETPAFFILEALYKTGKINEPDFRTILAMQRYTPYFIDLFAASLKPAMTTTDIKDMYKYQVITYAEIVPRLEALGLPAELAQQYADLWHASVKLASPLDQTDAQTKVAATKQLSSATVLEAYTDKVIDNATALEYLQKLKYDEDEAKLILSITDYKNGQAYIKAQVALIKEDVSTGQLLYNDAISQLQTLNLTNDQFALYSGEIQRLLSRKPAIPGRAEAGDFLKKGIYTPQQYVDNMRLLGFNDNYIEDFMLYLGSTMQDIEGTDLQPTQ